MSFISTPKFNLTFQLFFATNFCPIFTPRRSMIKIVESKLKPILICLLRLYVTITRSVVYKPSNLGDEFLKYLSMKKIEACSYNFHG